MFMGQRKAVGPASVFGSDVIVSGGLVFSAGAVGEDEQGKLVEGTVRDRTKAAMQVVERRLATVGLDWTDVVHVTIYLSKYEQDFAAFNQAYAEGLPKDVPPPVRICVGVAALYAGTDVELSVVAALRETAA
ncbi:hypothetical protein EHS25_003622 [Saitozyma podzolica]|uniref:RidA family protein n=1 Tax=Saitozyma podzolica TaxID=1890683 RepID=A0A427Y7S3_9TREE|nr:hypothetical protein EHS25_003622 [Saitozyma podzolica]